jgi:general stress protein 26
MASRDMSMQVDFEWTYTKIDESEFIAYYLNDERQVEVYFSKEDTFVEIIIHFEANTKSDTKAQEYLWKAILDSFARYAESL